MELSIRGRFSAALLLIVLSMSAVYAASMGLFIEMLEYKLMHETLVRELAQQRVLLVRDPSWPGPTGGDIRRIVVDPAALGGISPLLANLADGAEREIKLDGSTYMVGRTDVGDRRLYVLLDIQPVEQIERRLTIIAAITVIAAAALALVLGSALGRRVIEQERKMAVSADQATPGENRD